MTLEERVAQLEKEVKELKGLVRSLQLHGHTLGTHRSNIVQIIGRPVQDDGKPIIPMIQY